MTDNILANIGTVEGIEYQPIPRRLKGSCPEIITDPSQILEYLQHTITPYLHNMDEELLSRISVRFFVLTEIADQLAELNNSKIGNITLRVEAVIPIGYNASVGCEISWVWVGGNTKSRKTNPELLSQMENHLTEINSRTFFNPFLNPDSSHEYLCLGTKERLLLLSESELPKFVTTQIITDSLSDQIAALYKERIPQYIADNGNSEFIKKVLANNSDTVLFVARDPYQNRIDAVLVNEFTSYPVRLKSKKGIIKICESNDWVRGKNSARGALYSLISAAMINAVRRDSDLIEAECIPESFYLASHIGFKKTQKPLERTSFMITDGKNIELDDDTIPIAFRKFNSLFLMYINHQSDAWKYWKKLSRKETVKK
jgi:hypothetical protein